MLTKVGLKNLKRCKPTTSTKTTVTNSAATYTRVLKLSDINP